MGKASVAILCGQVSEGYGQLASLCDLSSTEGVLLGCAGYNSAQQLSEQDWKNFPKNLERSHFLPRPSDKT